ncbi:hypothetical protein [Lachnospira pectinoschiza]|uniref:Glycosyltransferase RgtA/B/C/D-like domain-containing protein n=1 Tax=Lachnospira pectinoschiza TaxID=28052 RepID=A0A1G9SSY9_9FIRM|nr:hypothetical protein [Lachnospira pectinoschiza]SDM38531.1 hypothetical protein SAMN05216544_0079 [Lachnospira pectinoschiza]
MNKYKKAAIFVFLFVLYSAFIIWRFSFWALNSDYANLVLEAKDILSGNFFRSNWNLTGISFLFTDVIYYIIGVLVAGVSSRAYVIASGLMQIALVLVSLLLIKDKFEKSKWEKGLLFLIYAMLPGLFALNLLRAHVGVFVISFVNVFIVTKLNECVEKKKIILLGLLYIILTALAVESDPIIILLLIAPMCFWAFWSFILDKISLNRAGIIVAINAIGLITGFLLDKLYFFVGGANKNSFLDSKFFVSLESLPSKIIVYIRSILYLVDGNFENTQLFSVKTVFYAINVLIVLMFFCIIISNIIKFLSGKDYDFITTILGLAFIIMSLVFIMTTISVDYISARYLSFFDALVAIVFIRNYDNLIINKNKKTKITVLITLLLVLVLKAYMVHLDEKESTDDTLQLIETLEDNNLTTGYAGFWEASKLTVLSRESVKVRAVICEGEDYGMYNWFCKSSWYEEPSNYIIVYDGDIFGINSNNIFKILGQPQKVLESGQYKICVYDYDISTKLAW